MHVQLASVITVIGACGFTYLFTAQRLSFIVGKPGSRVILLAGMENWAVLAANGAGKGNDAVQIYPSGAWVYPWKCRAASVTVAETGQNALANATLPALGQYATRSPLNAEISRVTTFDHVTPAGWSRLQGAGSDLGTTLSPAAGSACPRPPSTVEFVLVVHGASAATISRTLFVRSLHPQATDGLYQTESEITDMDLAVRYVADYSNGSFGRDGDCPGSLVSTGRFNERAC